MDNKTTSLLFKIKKVLANDSRIVALNEAEKAMNDSEEVMKLSYKKDLAADEYGSMLKIFGDEAVETVESRKRLALAKKELEEHPLVRDYLAKYKEVRKLYDFINDSLFSYLNNDMCPKE